MLHNECRQIQISLAKRENYTHENLKQPGFLKKFAPANISCYRYVVTHGHFEQKRINILVA